MKRLTTLTLLMILAIPVAGLAKDMTGKYGLGYFHNDAPVGARFWLSPVLGVDLGLGFESQNVYVGTEKETATSFWVEAGFPYVIVPSERANFFVRPGVTFAQLDDRAYGLGDNLDEKWTKVTFTLTPGAEVFFGDHFSLTAGHGIAIDMVSVPDDVSGPRGGESETTIRTFDGSVTYFGFHFYFK